MTVDRNSLGYRILVPSFFIIAIVCASLLFLIKNITDSIQNDYIRFTLSSVSGEVQKVFSSTARDLIAARLADNPVVVEEKQESVLEALTLLWKRMGYDGVVADAGGSILYSSLAAAPARTLLHSPSTGYYKADTGSGHVHCYAENFPLWGWRAVTINRQGIPLLSGGKVAILIPLVALGCLLMVGGIFWILRKAVKQPLHSLVSAVSGGEAVGRTGLTEFDIIGTSVNAAFQKLREKTAALQNELEERSRAEEKIRARDIHIRRLLDFTEEGIFGLDRDGICTFCNRSCLSMLGYDREEQLLGTAIHALVHHTRCDGTHYARQDCVVHTGLLTGESTHIENELFYRADGSSLPVEYWSHPITDNGDISGAVVTFIDISQRKLLEDQLIQAQKMESIGQLAGGVAHDFNNLLTPIIGFSEILKYDLQTNQAALDKLDNILIASEKAKTLVQQLLSFSRKQVLKMKTIDLNRVIAEFRDILRHSIRESIELHMCLPDQPYGIRADRNQIEQVIMNLTVNAQDAIGDRGSITIETAPVLLDDEYARQHPESKPGHYLMLAVSDNGCGMDQQTRQRIFEPFFTTKGIGKGTGLGLATVYGIVRQHGGNIWVYSEPDKGTTFKCYFPLVDGPLSSEQSAAMPEQAALEGRQRTILLVEDNAMVRALVDELLTRQGFRVLVAENPHQALEISGDHPLDLLISDVVMPHMTGPELHARLQEGYPEGLKVLYISGYTNNVIVHQGVLQEGIHYIQKPFAIHDFSRRVERLLAA